MDEKQKSRLISRYSEMGNDELVSLLDEPEGLTEEGKFALNVVMQSRGYSAGSRNHYRNQFPDEHREMSERIQKAPNLRVSFMWNIFGLVFGVLYRLLSADVGPKKRR
jgi:hypothetical protein